MNSRDLVQARSLPRSLRAACAAAGLAATLAWAATVRADPPIILVPGQPPSPLVIGPTPATETVLTYVGPNRALLTSGIVAFGVSYGVAVIVAAESDHYGDSHLYVPIAGPWIDIADRGSCGPRGSSPCGNETANDVGLAVDGLFQVIGALAIAGSFIWPEATHTVAGSVGGTVVAEKEPPKPEIHITPTAGRNGTGLAVLGTF